MQLEVGDGEPSADARRDALGEGDEEERVEPVAIEGAMAVHLAPGDLRHEGLQPRGARLGSARSAQRSLGLAAHDVAAATQAEYVAEQAGKYVGVKVRGGDRRSHWNHAFDEASRSSDGVGGGAKHPKRQV